MSLKKMINIAAAVLTVALIALLAFNNFYCTKAPLLELLKNKGSFESFTEQVRESYVSDIREKYLFVNLNGLYHRLCGRRVCNGVMKLNNGMLTEAHTPDCDVTSMAKGINSLNKYVTECGSKFMYVQLPYKLDAESELLPYGADDASNRNADKLISLLDEDVDILDTRPYLAATPEQITQNFFKTDHHWNYYGAFQGFSLLINSLSEKFPDSGIDTACADIENWEAHTINSWLLGSRGRRIGQYFAGLDDMTYYTPKFDTSITCDIVDTAEHYEGSFEDAAIREQFITGSRDPFEKNAYCMYMGSDYELVRTRSESASGKLKVLLIKESFSLPVMAYLSTAISCVDTVDPRYADTVELVRNLFDETQPDIVILMLNPNIIHLCPSYYSDFGTD